MRTSDLQPLLQRTRELLDEQLEAVLDELRLVAEMIADSEQSASSPVEVPS